jgi:hypothetical protein
MEKWGRMELGITAALHCLSFQHLKLHFTLKWLWLRLLYAVFQGLLEQLQQTDRLKAMLTTQAILRKIGQRRILEAGASKAVWRLKAIEAF